MPDTAPAPAFVPSPRSRVRRHPERARYDRETVFAILDSALMCHVGYVIDGRPYVTPTLFWRHGETLYRHGSSASRMLRTQASGIPVCVTVAHADGLVLARSAFHHSLNFRAVMAFGTASIVTDLEEKVAGFNAFIDRLYPGRLALMREVSVQEIKATTLMSMVIEEASAKVRDDGPIDLESDLDAPCWAGTIPISQIVGAGYPDARAAPRADRGSDTAAFPEGAVFDKVLLALARQAEQAEEAE